MSQYPVESSDQLFQAVNYLLSGPGGLGQNFQGFSSYAPGWLTGNFRQPYSESSAANLYVAPIALNAAEMLDGRTFKFTFSVAEPVPPFAPGQNITISNVPFTSVSATGTVGTVTGSDPWQFQLTNLSDTSYLFINAVVTATNGTGSFGGGTAYVVSIDSATSATIAVYGGTTPTAGSVTAVEVDAYNGKFVPIGVAECTTTYVIVRTDKTYPIQPNANSGTAEYSNTVVASTPGSVYPIGTDCNAKVLVNSGTDRVFISGQLLNTISYTATTASDLQYTVQISRYRGFINSDPVNPEYRFDFEQTIAQRVYSGGALNGLTGTGTLDPIETIFTAILDQPPVGYYWYFLEVEFAVTNGGDLQVTASETAQRSFSSQVVKQ